MNGDVPDQTRPGERRLIRALERGGVAFLQSSGWEVRRRPDARIRAIGRLSKETAGALIEAGDLRPVGERGERLIWARAASGASHPGLCPPPTPAPSRAGRKTLLTKALEGADDGRLAAAVARLAADVERAATPASVAMRWDDTPATSARRAGRAPSGVDAVAAERRLRRLQDVLGAADFRDLQRVVVEQISARRFAETIGVRPAEAVERVAVLLIALADAYDRHIAPERGFD
ncbi:MAG: hypothetical protein AAFX03_04975 [Pseudomonadota bacterium]